MKRRLHVSLILLFGAILLFNFQNCGQFETPKVAVSDDGSNFQLMPKDYFPMTTWEDDFPAPQKVTDCRTNSEFNLCLTYKDPLSMVGTVLRPEFTVDSALPAHEDAVFVWGVKAPTTPLRNSHFVIDNGWTSYTDVALTSNGDWKHAFRGDTNHNVAQLHMFYWVNRLRTYLTKRSGKFYYSRLAAPLRAHLQHTIDPDIDDAANNNAFFYLGDNSINAGYSTLNRATPADAALDLSAIVHEAGHGNLHIATNEAVGSASSFCSTKSGCFGAIHEGVGDLHSLFMFPDRAPIIGAYFANSMSGLRNIGIGANRTVGYYWTKSYPNGEIHDMGEAYASVWYQVWKSFQATGEERQIEQLFTDHLAFVSTADTFTTMLRSIETLAKSGNYPNPTAITTAFRAQYARMGIPQP